MASLSPLLLLFLLPLFLSLLHPEDIIPLLPRQVYKPILSSLRRPVDLLPRLVGRVSAKGHVEWKGACFDENTAWLVFHNKTGSKFGGGTLHIKVSQAHGWTCMDLYVFATPFGVKWDYYLKSGEHTVEFEEWKGKAEFEYMKRIGVFIFHLPTWKLGTLRALWEVYPLFTNSGWGEKSNIDFLKKHMGASFEQRPQPWVTNISVDDIHSGDFLAISKIRGRWGGLETLEKWVSGAYAGHIAVCLKDSEGKLWVGDGHENEKGENIISVLPWGEWWELELNKDLSNPHIALLPLHPDMRAKFNQITAWEYAESMNGNPHGYHNLIFSWIDTINANYPPPLDADVIASVMTVWNHIQPAHAANMWNEALNMRLGTKGLGLPDILVEAETRGSSFAELLTIPEQDNWVYSDRKSTSSVAFVLGIYKAAGLFDPISSSIQITEFTIRDAYSLRFFENNSSRLPKWCNDGDEVKLPFCQILGMYRMELPGYNTMDPYPHMNEKCPSLPPKYSRPSDC